MPWQSQDSGHYLVSKEVFSHIRLESMTCWQSTALPVAQNWCEHEIDRHVFSVVCYMQAKHKIVRHQGKNDTVILVRRNWKDFIRQKSSRWTARGWSKQQTQTHSDVRSNWLNASMRSCEEGDQRDQWICRRQCNSNGKRKLVTTGKHMTKGIERTSETSTILGIIL